jgi:hypothetical protein
LGKSRAARGLAVAVRGKVAVETRHVVPAARRKPGRREPDMMPRRPRPPPIADGRRLQNIINDIWKHAGKANTKGDGTTFDALINELRTGTETSGKRHLRKAADLMRRLHEAIKDPSTSARDRAIADDLLDQFAIAWKARPR